MLNPAHLLIERFCDLCTFESYHKAWTIEAFAENEPRKVRLAMIDSLFSALGIRCSYYEFSTGEFITHVVPIDRVLEIMSACGISKESWLIPATEQYLREGWDLDTMRFTFFTLMKYRSELEIYRTRGSGTLNSSMKTILPQVIIGNINEKIVEAATPINRLLVTFLNPDETTMDLETLREKYKYPDVNLGELDMDWL